MSHVTNWKVSQVKTLMPCDNVRIPHERKKENKKHEEHSDGQAWPRGQVLQTGEGAPTTEDGIKDTGGDKSTEEHLSLSKTEPRHDAKDREPPVPLGPVYPRLISSPSTKAGGRSWDLFPPTAKNFRIHDQGPFRRFLDMKAEKRLASWKERRSRYGDINMHKCYPLGQVFTPFRALATTEMRRLVFPQHLPRSPRTRRLGTPCTDEGSLQDLPLSSSELGLGKDDNNHEREKQASHVRTPLFPPIVKATQSNNRK
ncbi:uncharacterized protein LOC118634044 [Molossus molossus]|uniref:uncharacterized protein LOC118634044 n=1 Tax=Molossus molossus TaxID=27622 RepID=UPI0017466D48|nr:uncharacterized protein LOC118634044 [Molossus molossus]